MPFKFSHPLLTGVVEIYESMKILLSFELGLNVVPCGFKEGMLSTAPHKRKTPDMEVKMETGEIPGPDKSQAIPGCHDTPKGVETKYPGVNGPRMNSLPVCYNTPV